MKKLFSILFVIFVAFSLNVGKTMAVSLKDIDGSGGIMVGHTEFTNWHYEVTGSQGGWTFDPALIEVAPIDPSSLNPGVALTAEFQAWEAVGGGSLAIMISFEVEIRDVLYLIKDHSISTEEHTNEDGDAITFTSSLFGDNWDLIGYVEILVTDAPKITESSSIEFQPVSFLRTSLLVMLETDEDVRADDPRAGIDDDGESIDVLASMSGSPHPRTYYYCTPWHRLSRTCRCRSKT